MTMASATRKTSAAYRAAVLIFNEGPMTVPALFARVDFGTSNNGRRACLQRAFDAGTLQRSVAGSIDITDDMRDELTEEARKPSHPITGVGTVATGPTINMLTRPPLSKKYMPNSRGIRTDQPEWAKRPEGFTLRTVA